MASPVTCAPVPADLGVSPPGCPSAPPKGPRTPLRRPHGREAGGGTLKWTASEDADWLGRPGSGPTRGRSRSRPRRLGSAPVPTRTELTDGGAGTQNKYRSRDRRRRTGTTALTVTPARLLFSATRERRARGPRFADRERRRGRWSGPSSENATGCRVSRHRPDGDRSSSRAGLPAGTIGHLRPTDPHRSTTARWRPRARSPVTFTVEAPPPVLAVSPSSLSFWCRPGRLLGPEDAKACQPSRQGARRSVRETRPRWLSCRARPATR